MNHDHCSRLLWMLSHLLLSLLLTCAARAQPSGPDGAAYKSGYSSIMKLGRDIYHALQPAHREIISVQPISIETDNKPFVRLLYYRDEPRSIRGVWISAGFIDLVNHVAHADAIDQKVNGYFARYIEMLAQETGEAPLRPLPNPSSPAYWTDEVLNEQLSNFNSIVGILVGIKLAHHYLGHYDKYKDRIEDQQGHRTSINNLLTLKEWHDAFAHGVRNALEAGCTTEGAARFFEAFDSMDARPPWAAYFLPDSVKSARLKAEMENIQRRFFLENEQ